MIRRRKIINKFILLIPLLSLLSGCLSLPSLVSEGKPKLDIITLPHGFSISVFAENVPGARSMVLSPDGTLFVGTRGNGNVYAVLDHDRDNKADEVKIIASELNMPNGIAFKDGSWVKLNEYTKESWQSLNELPDWYMYVLVAVVVDVLGFRSFMRKIIDKWSNKFYIPKK